MWREHGLLGEVEAGLVRVVALYPTLHKLLPVSTKHAACHLGNQTQETVRLTNRLTLQGVESAPSCHTCRVLLKPWFMTLSRNLFEMLWIQRLSAATAKFCMHVTWWIPSFFNNSHSVNPEHASASLNIQTQADIMLIFSQRKQKS